MASAMRAAARSPSFARFLGKSHQTHHNLRTRGYLTAAYRCDDDWVESRRRDPLLAKVNPDQLFVDLSRSIGAKARHDLAVDCDLFLSAIDDMKFSEEAKSIVSRLRRSRHTIRTLPSTSTAVIRYFLALQLDDQLLKMLPDKYNYGIFPDVQTFNLLMDHFIEKKDFRGAAKVAADMMWQEDEGNEISRCLALIACERYLSNYADLQPWHEVEVKDGDEEEEEDDETEYVRVPCLTNYWFDDHFDLLSPHQIVGKTLTYFGAKAQNQIVKDSATIIGLVQGQKWDELEEYLKTVKQVTKDTAALCQVSCVQETEQRGSTDASNTGGPPEPIPKPEWVDAQVDKLQSCEATLLSLLEEELASLDAVKESDMNKMKATFSEYTKQRQQSLDAKFKAIDREKRYEILKQKKKELVEREEFLYAFENWNRIELILRDVEEAEAKKKTVTEDKEYVPPTIDKPFNQRKAN